MLVFSQPKAGEDSPAANTALVLSDNCGSSYSKWTFTDGGSIKHSSSGLCWNPISGSVDPRNGNKVILKSNCDQATQQFTWAGKAGTKSRRTEPRVVIKYIYIILYYFIVSFCKFPPP